METYRKIWRLAYKVQAVENDTETFEVEVLCAFAMRFVNINYAQFRKQLATARDFESRIQHTVDTVMESGRFKDREIPRFAAEALCNRIRAADKYQSSDKLTGDIVLIKAEIGNASKFGIGHDYGLSEVATGSVSVHVVEGDHDTFVHGASAHSTANIVEAVIDR
jgi:fatty acid synthase